MVIAAILGQRWPVARRNTLSGSFDGLTRVCLSTFDIGKSVSISNSLTQPTRTRSISSRIDRPTLR